RKILGDGHAQLCVPTGRLQNRCALVALVALIALWARARDQPRYPPKPQGSPMHAQRCRANSVPLSPNVRTSDDSHVRSACSSVIFGKACVASESALNFFALRSALVELVGEERFRQHEMVADVRTHIRQKLG